MSERTLAKLRYITSFSCAVHCMVTPFLILVLPAFGRFISNIWMELFILSISILTGAWIIYKGYCTHKKKHAMAIFMLGTISWIIHMICETFGWELLETSLLIIGSICIVGAYLMNHRFSKCCSTHHDH